MLADLQYVHQPLIHALDKRDLGTSIPLLPGQLEPLLDPVTAAIEAHC